MEEMKSHRQSYGPAFLTSATGCLFQLTHAIRLLLEYTDTSYEEKRYTMGDGNSTLLFRPLPNLAD